jgi:hypothetical protein
VRSTSLLNTKKSMPSRSKARGQLKSINSFREVRSMTGISTHLTISPRWQGRTGCLRGHSDIARMNMVAIGWVVLTRRKHIMALEAKGRGLATVPCSALTHRPR